MPVSELPMRRTRPVVVAAALAVVALLSAVGPMAAAEPIDLRDARMSDRPVLMPIPPVVPRPDPPLSPSPTPTPSPTPPVEPIGYDVSWPQCNDELPDLDGFAIVGVNQGRVHSVNPCLTDQLEWAGADADLYMNTANPGPSASRYWPSGQEEPRACNTPDARGADTASCAYDYGWNAAAHAYAAALDAFVELDWADADDDQLPGDRTWWLDVETANSWRWNRSLNVAALQGAVDFLESTGADVGFYSTPLLWWRVTFGTDDFDDYPAWHAGAHSRHEAQDRCSHDAFTGGELRFVQWIEDGIDTNLRCDQG